MSLKIFLLTICIGIAFADVVSDKVDVTLLPGWPAAINFQIYSGYLNISGSSEKAIHYVLMTQNNTKSTTNNYPLLLWSNGGPGCTSLLGAFQEIGPYVQEDGQTSFNGTYNVWSWGQFANLLFFESPAGVGFSPNDVENPVYNDPLTAADQYAALIDFFSPAKYPELAGNDFWIAGESYAGVYIPTLAQYIDQQNNNASQTLKMNLKGIMVGNGVVERSSLDNSTIQFFNGHNLVSPYVFNMYTTACTQDEESAACQYALNMIDFYTSNINPYDIYRYCYYENYEDIEDSNEDIEAQYKAKYTYRYHYTPWHKRSKKIAFDGSNNSPCTWSLGLQEFFNNATVQNAFNVDPTNWQECNDTIFALYNSTGSYEAYQYLLNTNKYKIVIYSGDTDSVVPFDDTLGWVGSFGLNVVEQWRPWWVEGLFGAQVAGYVQTYQGLTFVTVKGVGHMVPQWKRLESMVLFNSTLNGVPLPTNPFANQSTTISA